MLNPRVGSPGLLTLCILICWCGLLPAYSAHAASISVQVGANNDDAEERISDGNMYRNSSDLELVHDGGTEQIVGLRFRNINVPSGVTITNAYIQFTVDEVDTGATEVIVEGQYIGDAPGFTNADSNISNRTPTSANQTWTIPPWTSIGDAGTAQRTPDLSNVVTEILSHPGWSNGNDMVMMIRAGSGCSSSACQRTAESRNGSAALAPTLYIEWSNPNAVDLTITMSDAPDPVTVGGTFAYQLDVTNAGGLPATGVVASDTLPAAVTLQSVTTSKGSCTGTSTVTCTIGDLAPAETVQIAIVATADTFGVTNNTATVTGNETDDDPSNNSATEATSVSANTQQLCYVVADSGGGNGGNDLLTRVDTADGNPATNETNIGSGTGTTVIEAIAWNSATMTLYAANANRLGILSTTTGVFNALPSTFGTGGDGLGNNLTFNDVDALSYDATTGILWGVNANSGNDALFQINMATGVHIPNAFGPGVDYVVVPAILGNSITDDIAVDPTTGIMYASVNSGGSTDRLITIDKATGATTDIAQITVPDIEGLGTDATGQLWGTSGTQNVLYEIDKNTGIGSLGRPLDNGSDYESVDCYATSTSITADVAMAKTVDNPTPLELSSIIYTVTATNNGTGPVTALQVSDVIPSGLTVSSASVSQGIYDSGNGNWFVGSIANGGNATLTITATVDTGTAGSVITNTAIVTSATQTDPNASNNSASVDIDIAGIEVSKTSSVVWDPVTNAIMPKAIPGSRLRYLLDIVNDSAATTDAGTLEIIDELPLEVAFVVGDPDSPFVFADGTPSSGLTLVFLGYNSTVDDIDFSDDTDFSDGITWNYFPSTVSYTDPAVTAIRFRPQGSMQPTGGAGAPNFEITYLVEVE